ncbi:unnamed protein product [Dibothriocephalus latus]|uniref:Uncharacterized protein n=1 Tax=Dibothriocephalus latus TaxID=60516 RepID=A0A3P7QSX9_DIBLA|nr:unnamed protein product [Dibothriocephalus latus]
MDSGGLMAANGNELLADVNPSLVPVSQSVNGYEAHPVDVRLEGGEPCLQLTAMSVSPICITAGVHDQSADIRRWLAQDMAKPLQSATLDV